MSSLYSLMLYRSAMQPSLRIQSRDINRFTLKKHAIFTDPYTVEFETHFNILSLNATNVPLL
jgi:hypothetical protein